MAYKLAFLLAIISFCEATETQKYKVPTPKIEATSPIGLKVTLPDDGYTFFSFHWNINKEIKDLEAGQWFADIRKPKGDKWVYWEIYPHLKVGDTIYYWLYVIKDGVGYLVKDQQFTINEKSKELVPIIPTRPPPPPQPRPTQPPQYHPCDSSITDVKDNHEFICAGELIFSEDFDKPSLEDLGNWDPEISFHEEPDYLFNVYQPNGTIQMKYGSLIITPRAMEDIVDTLDLGRRCTGYVNTRQCKQVTFGSQIIPPTMTGKITTKKKFSFRYGRIEISAKLPSGDWLIPELTLEPLYSVYGSGQYQSGIMRVAYMRGSPLSSKRLSGGPVLADNEPFRSYLLREKVGKEGWNANFHNYTLLWTPEGIELFVDGERYGTVSPGFLISGVEYQVPHAERWSTATMAPLDEFFYISLGLGVGGVHDFPDIPSKPWRNKSIKAMIDFWKARDDWCPTWKDANLAVDYVRVYAL